MKVSEKRLGFFSPLLKRGVGRETENTYRKIERNILEGRIFEKALRKR